MPLMLLRFIKKRGGVVAQRLVIIHLAVVVYFGLPLIKPQGISLAGQFPRLAQAFLDGSLSLDLPGEPEFQNCNELIPSEDGASFYCPYPPLPGILLMPFVAIFGTAVRVQTACHMMSVTNILLFDMCLDRLPRRLGQADFRLATRVALNLFFAFGTVTWHNADMGGDWHLAHAVALGAMLLALLEFAGANRSLIVGCFVALALLTRPTAGLACLFFVPPLLRTRSVAGLLRLAAAPVLAVALLGLYNYARFANPLDFGYDRMILGGLGGRLMAAHGQFDPHYIGANFFWFFLAPPWPLPHGGLPWLGYDPRGLSLFIASPVLLCCLATVRRHWKMAVVRDACLGIAAALVPLLMYFNTGYWQFGHRFSMDYLPLLLVLLIAERRERYHGSVFILIGISLCVQAWGVILNPVMMLPEWLVPMP